MDYARLTMMGCVAIAMCCHAAHGLETEPLIVVQSSESRLYGAMTFDGELAVPYKFTGLKALSHGFAAATTDTIHISVHAARRPQWGVIDASGAWVLEPQFEHVSHFERGMAYAVTRQFDRRGDRWQPLPTDECRFVILTRVDGKINVSEPIHGQPVAETNREQRLLFIRETDEQGRIRQYGVIGPKGKVILDPVRGNGIGAVGPFHGSFAAASNEDQPRPRWGYINREGQWIVQPQFDRTHGVGDGYGLISMADADHPLRFSEMRFIYLDGSLAIDHGFSHDTHPFREGRARSSRDGQIGYIDRTGNWRIEPAYKAGHDFSEGLAGVSLDGERWGYIDPSGRWAIEPTFDKVESFTHGLARVAQGERTGWIDRDGQWFWIDGQGRANQAGANP